MPLFLFAAYPTLPFNMPRKIVPTGHRTMDRTNLEAAFKHRVATGCSLKQACEKFGVKKMTLSVSILAAELTYFLSRLNFIQDWLMLHPFYNLI